jgi:hypothetical protein
MLLALAILLPVPEASAVDAIDAALKQPSLDLVPYLSWVETGKTTIAVERLADGAQPKALMTLKAGCGRCTAGRCSAWSIAARRHGIW